MGAGEETDMQAQKLTGNSCRYVAILYLFDL